MRDSIIQKYSFQKAGQYRDICPECSHQRKKKGRKDLSVGVKEDGSVVWMCQHCGWQDGGKIEETRNVVKFTPPPQNKNLSTEAIEFLSRLAHKAGVTAPDTP